METVHHPVVPVAEVPVPHTSPRRRWWSHLLQHANLFWTVHLVAILGVIWCGWSWAGAGLAIAAYSARMVVVTAAYHRYFSHRTFKTSRVFQFLLALGAQSSAQKGVLWWASHHRRHHRYSDTDKDVHSPKQRGLYYAHLGWILDSEWDDTDYASVPDLAKYPELRFLNRGAVELLPAAVLGLAFLLIGGVPGFVWGFLVSTVLLWHGTFTINSLSHVLGRRRFHTTDDSRNNWVLAIITGGEGWHNNHHHYPSSTNQGFRWWEIDVTYYALWLLAGIGLVWNLRRPPPAALVGEASS